MGGISLWLRLYLPLAKGTVTVTSINGGPDVAAISTISVGVVDASRVSVRVVDTVAVDQGGIGLRLRLCLPLAKGTVTVTSINGGPDVAAISTISIGVVDASRVGVRV